MDIDGITRILTNFSSAFFLASGCWGDLLFIRFFLTCAYAFLLAFSIVVDGPNPENYFWSIACLYLHGSSAVRLILDEGSVKLDESQEQEALWRYFYRRSGVSRLLFKRYVAPCFELVDVKKGTKLNTNNYFYIILNGAVDIESTVSGSTREFTLFSGETFDIKHLVPLFGGRSANMNQSLRISPFANQTINATVSVDAKIYRCSEKSVADLCSQPACKEASQGLLISSLSCIAERQYIERESVTKDTIDEESQIISDTRSKVFDPLSKSEEPAPYLAGSGSLKGFHRHLLHTLKVTFLLPWPLMKWLPGLRQIGSLPVPHASAPTSSSYNASSPLLEEA